jgi:hypothetical protein
MFVPLRCSAWPMFVLQVIHHYQYTEWPDYGRPEKVEPLIELLEEVHSVHPTTAPIVVHCSAGVGRTGTLCAIDTAAQLLRTGVRLTGCLCLLHTQRVQRMTPSFDVLDLVCELRRLRPAMVQSLVCTQLYTCLRNSGPIHFRQSCHCRTVPTKFGIPRLASPCQRGTACMLCMRACVISATNIASTQ